MKKRSLLKRFMALGMSVMIGVGCMSNVCAADSMAKSSGEHKILTEEEARLVDDKLAEIDKLELKQHKLEEQIRYVAAKTYSRATQVNSELAEIDEEIEQLYQEISDLGASKPSEEMYQNLIEDELIATSDKARMSGTHLEQYISILEQTYKITAYYMQGPDGREQYHILVNNKGKTNLAQYGGVIVTDPTLSESEKVEEVTSMVLSVSAQRFVENSIEKYIVDDDIIPWDLVSAYFGKESSVICRADSSIAGVYGIVSSVKFVYVYEENRDNWKLALTTNRVIETYGLEAVVLEDDYKFVRHTLAEIDGREMEGLFHRASADAAAAYAAGEFRSTCMYAWAWAKEIVIDGLKYNTELVILDLPTPDSIGELVP